MTRQPFRFAMYRNHTSSRREWEETARRAEGLGYSSLFMPDHITNPLPPAPMLAFAAAVTTTLRLGCVVFANDFRHPAILAKEAAALDLLSEGRFEFGLGAGWLEDEYERAGIQFDRPGVRIARMQEALTVLRGLWTEGPFSFQGEHYTITDLTGTPKPVQKPHPPIFIGGTGRKMLQLAAREANIVGMLPKTLPRGGHDWASSTMASLEERIGWVREAAGERLDDLELSIVIFRAIITDRPREVAAELASGYGVTPEHVLASPDFLIGSEDEIVERLEERRERFGISYIEIFDRDAAAFAPVVARLTGR